MVFSCVREEVEVGGGESMAMGQERSSKPLHNFTLPCTLKWGHQRHFRCVKVHDSSATPAVEGVDHRPVRRRSSPSRVSGFLDAGRRRERESMLLLPSSRRMTDFGEEEEEEGIEAVREKIMNDLKTAADKMKDAILREETVVSDGDEEEEESPVSAVAAAVAAVAQGDSVRPWNLRTRRAACKAPVGGGPPASSASKGLLKIEEKKPSSSSSPMRSEVGAKSPRVLRGGAGAAAAEKEVKKERLKFSVALSKKEIEEDFMQMVNHRPPRRPKKRPRNVQRQLDTLFPGLWLTEVNADSYKVPELPENGKR